MKKTTLISTLVISLVATAGVGAAAAFQDDWAPDKPGAQHEWMKRHVGVWDAKINSMGVESTGTWTVRSAHGGLWNIGQFEGEMSGAPFTGSEFLGFDPKKGKYVSTWIDSTSASLGILEGTFNADTQQLVMEGETIGADGKPAATKNITHFKGMGKMSFGMIMKGPDGSDFPVLQIEYTRRAMRDR